MWFANLLVSQPCSDWVVGRGAEELPRSERWLCIKSQPLNKQLCAGLKTCCNNNTAYSKMVVAAPTVWINYHYLVPTIVTTSLTDWKNFSVNYFLQFGARDNYRDEFHELIR